MLQKLREEQASRLLFERSVREEMEKRWQSLKAYIDEEAHSIRQSEKVGILLGCVPEEYAFKWKTQPI